MKYIIVDTDEQSGIDLKKILDGYEALDFQGSFTSQETAEKSIHGESPDIAFLRIGKVELNAFKLTCEIRELNSAAKVVLLSNHEEYAVEAFECEADGFLLIPFDRVKINRLLLQDIERKRITKS